MQFECEGSSRFNDVCRAINRIFYSHRREDAPRDATDIIWQADPVHGNDTTIARLERRLERVRDGDLISGVVYINADSVPSGEEHHFGTLNIQTNRYGPFLVNQFLQALADAALERCGLTGGGIRGSKEQRQASSA